MRARVPRIEHACTLPTTRSSASARPAITTSTIGVPVAARASISASCAPGRPMSARQCASPGQDRLFTEEQDRPRRPRAAAPPPRRTRLITAPGRRDAAGCVRPTRPPPARGSPAAAVTAVPRVAIEDPGPQLLVRIVGERADDGQATGASRSTAGRTARRLALAQQTTLSTAGLAGDLPDAPGSAAAGNCGGIGIRVVEQAEPELGAQHVRHHRVELRTSGCVPPAPATARWSA